MDDRAAIELARRDPRRQLGRFLVLGELGRGGMGVVYRAWDPAADRTVALKLLLEDDPEASARFRREGDAVARLQHPGIVRVHEQGVLGARPFVVMELVDGRSLEKAPAPLPVAQAVGLTRALCDALAHAHGRGVVHRDLKPSNVIVGPDGQPRVLDFGLAKLLDRSRLTRSGSLLGTASYMAPEQLDGKADARSDIYSLGATLYWLLTGQAPFTGDTTQNIIVALARKPVEPPSRLNPEVTPELEGVLLRCLAKNPDLRYPTAAEFSDALGRALEGEQVERRAPLAGRLVAALAGGALLAGVLAVSVWWAARDGQRDGASAVPEATTGPAAVDAAGDAAREALEQATSALAAGDAARALEAIATARSASVAPRVKERAAALEGEARWLQGDLAAVERSAKGADPRSATLLRALLRAAREEKTTPEPLLQRPFSKDELGNRPAGAFGKAMLAGTGGDAAKAAKELEAAGATDATPLFVALVRASHFKAAGWLLPKVDVTDAATKDASAVVACARALLDARPDEARELVAAACKAGLASEARATVVADALARVPEGLDLLTDPTNLLTTYRRAIARYRVALAVDPSVPPPAALREFVERVPGPHLDGDTQNLRREAQIISSNYFRSRRDPKDLEAAVQQMRALTAAATPQGKRWAAYSAVEFLCQAGDNDGARAWIEEACAPVERLGLDDHDVIVQWARTLWAPAQRRVAWMWEALPLLDRVIEEDPLHGDARELRAAIVIDLDAHGATVDLDRAEADLALAVHDYARAAASTMRGVRRNPESVARFQENLRERRRQRR